MTKQYSKQTVFFNTTLCEENDNMVAFINFLKCIFPLVLSVYNRGAEQLPPYLYHMHEYSGTIV